MATNLQDRPSSVYDDEEAVASQKTTDAAKLKELELSQGFSGDPEEQDNNGINTSELEDREDNATQDNDKSGDLFNPSEDEPKNPGGRIRTGISKLTKKKRSVLFIGGGGMFGVIGILLLLVTLSSLKVVHFGQVLSTAGFVRLNSVFQERTTQILFDNAATVGEGDISLRGRSIIDKVKFRNLDGQVAELGQQGKLKFLLDNGNMQGIELPQSGKRITLDGITKELGFGEKFSDISKGWSKLNPNDYRRVATVRNEFIKQSRIGISEGLGLESRAVRGRTNKIISDNIGFKFNRWRQKARSYAGLKPNEARIKNTVELAEDVSGRDIVQTGVDELDLSQEQMKSEAKLKAFLEKNDGVFDKQKFMSDVLADAEKGKKVQNAAQKVGLGVMIGSIACMTNQAMSRVDDIAAQNERQAEKQASLQMGAKDQQLQGGANDEALGAEASSLTGGESSPWYQYTQKGEVNSDAVSAPRIRPQYGNIAKLIETVTSPTRLLAGQTGFLLPDDIVNQTDTAFCNTLLSPEGAVAAVGVEIIATVAVSFLTGGGAAAVEQGGGRIALSVLTKELATASFSTARGLLSKESLGVIAGVTAYQLGLEFAVRQLSGTDFMGAEQGAEKVERNGIGASLLQSRKLRAAGGAPISNEEAAEVDKPYMKEQRTAMNKGSVFARYLSIENPYSLVGSLSANTSINTGTPGTVVASTASQMSSLFNSSSILSTATSAFGLNKRASAAINYNPYFDVQQWGYNAAEMNLMRTDPSYSFFNNLDYISDSRVAELDKIYGKCFDPELLQVEVEKMPECSAQELRKNDEMFRYRLTKLDDEKNGVLAPLVQDAKEINAEPVETDETDGDTPAPDGAVVTDGTNCAEGSRDLGPGAGYVAGNPVQIKLCAITGFKSSSSESQPGNAFSVPNANGDTIVSAASSDGFVKLYQAMAAAGVKPSANSSFRTMVHQQQLCKDNPKCASGVYTRVAKPGTSNHQGGNAIDFANCSTRGTACYKWLSENAGKYGIKNYPEEPWHWSTTGQ